jgi:hypothetical protein
METMSTKAKPSGAQSVMASKRARVSDGQPWQDAELFPTPPWATRALMTHVLPLVDPGELKDDQTAWEPCAGLGHMSEVLAEKFTVIATDLHDYGVGIKKHDFFDDITKRGGVDWIITNPPFGLAEKMLRLALERADRGVAFLLRLPWLESERRYTRIFSTEIRPTLIAPFVERVPMCEGGYDPALSTATAYAWFVWRLALPVSLRRTPPINLVDHWRHGADMIPTYLIPPGRKACLTRGTDAKLATRYVPGWVPPSTLRRAGKNQIDMEDWTNS